MKEGAVFVCGSLHYDIVVTAPHMPASDETIIGKNVSYICGGKGGNQALAAVRHGASVTFAGRIGGDAPGEILIANLKAAGVDTHQIQRAENEASGMSVAILDSSGEYGAVVVSAANLGIDPELVDLPARTAIVLLQNEVPEAVNLDLATKARARGVPVMLNAAPMRPMASELLALVDILVVNRIEASALFGCVIDDVESVRAAVRDWQAHHQTLIVTLGGQGAVLCVPGVEPVHVPAILVRVVSAHGAGDAFCGALAARLALGDLMLPAIIYASALAACHVAAPAEARMRIGPKDVAAMSGNWLP